MYIGKGAWRIGCCDLAIRWMLSSRKGKGQLKWLGSTGYSNRDDDTNNNHFLKSIMIYRENDFSFGFSDFEEPAR